MSRILTGYGMPELKKRSRKVIEDQGGRRKSQRRSKNPMPRDTTSCQSMSQEIKKGQKPSWRADDVREVTEGHANPTTRWAAEANEQVRLEASSAKPQHSWDVLSLIMYWNGILTDDTTPAHARNYRHDAPAFARPRVAAGVRCGRGVFMNARLVCSYSFLGVSGGWRGRGEGEGGRSVFTEGNFNLFTFLSFFLAFTYSVTWMYVFLSNHNIIFLLFLHYLSENVALWFLMIFCSILYTLLPFCSHESFFKVYRYKW